MSAAVRPFANALAMPSERPLTVLLLEDSPLDVRLISAQLELEALTCRLECVADRVAFTRALERGGFDIILSDYNVPGFDGLSALAVARGLRPETPFLFVSGALGEERAIELLKQGATDYVLKDRLERLTPSMRRALREAEQEALRKRTEEALRRSEERYQLVIRATFDAVWDWDLVTDTVQWSDAAGQIFGHGAEGPRSEVSWWTSHVHDEDRERVLGSLRQALQGHVDRWQEEYRFLRQDGQYAYVAARGCIVRDVGGAPVRMVGAMQDITERRHAEEERQRLLREAHQRVEFEQQLVGIVSHDLRNPLSAILTGASLMLRRGDLTPGHARATTRVLSAAQRAHRMIRDLLDFTQARMGGGIPVHPQPSDFHELTSQVVEESRTAHPERDIQLAASGDGRGCWDADRMAQVISNILGNALRYSPGSTPVRVESRQDGGTMVLRVHNEGEPIPPELLPRIFEPLQRGTTASGSDRSIGLGLYIVRQLVEAHGGTVEAHSTREEGTTFTLRLPHAVPSAGLRS